MKSIWFRWVRLAGIFTLLLVSIVAVNSVFAASDRWAPGVIDCRSIGAERNCDVAAVPLVTGNLARNPSLVLATPRIITATIQSFTSLQVTIDRMENFPSGIGTPYIYRLSALVEQGVIVSDVAVTTAGGGTCTVLANMDISCSGLLSSLEISYRYAYTPTLHPPNVLLSIGGSDTTDVDYTVNVFYPSDFTFTDATPPPDAHNPANRSLVWTKTSAFEFRPEIRFLAMGLEGAWLPLIQR